MINLTICAFAVLSLFLRFAAGVTKHCYVCKSRGDQGDCKDPYDAEAGKVNIEACFTGWCIKTLDTDTELFPATERACMPNPPSDLVPRCTQATTALPGFPPKKVYVCYCSGDLCNKSGKISGSSALWAIAILVIVLLR